MAKKRIVRGGYKPIRNAGLIGKGGKRIKPIRGSWVKGFNKSIGSTKVKSSPSKKPIKPRVPIRTNPSFAKKIKPNKNFQPRKPIKVATSRKISSRMRQHLNKNKGTPSTKIKMKSKKPARKPPTRGR